MKKYIYTGISLGIIMLAGCSANEETAGVETLSDTDKKVAVSMTPLNLTQEQKEDYHKQYVEIVKEINVKEDKNHLEVEPIDKFKPEDWVEPEIFRQIAEDRATWEFTSKAFDGDPVD